MDFFYFENLGIHFKSKDDYNVSEESSRETRKPIVTPSLTTNSVFVQNFLINYHSCKVQLKISLRRNI